MLKRRAQLLLRQKTRLCSLTLRNIKRRNNNNKTTTVAATTTTTVAK